MPGHTHDTTHTSANTGNVLGDRSSVRQSKLYRQYESGNDVKDILGTGHLQWKTDKKEGVYDGHTVYDHQNPYNESSALAPIQVRRKGEKNSRGGGGANQMRGRKPQRLSFDSDLGGSNHDRDRDRDRDAAPLTVRTHNDLGYNRMPVSEQVQQGTSLSHSFQKKMSQGGKGASASGKGAGVKTGDIVGRVGSGSVVNQTKRRSSNENLKNLSPLGEKNKKKFAGAGENAHSASSISGIEHDRSGRGVEARVKGGLTASQRMKLRNSGQSDYPPIHDNIMNINSNSNNDILTADLENMSTEELLRLSQGMEELKKMAKDAERQARLDQLKDQLAAMDDGDVDKDTERDYYNHQTISSQGGGRGMGGFQALQAKNSISGGGADGRGGDGRGYDSSSPPISPRKNGGLPHRLQLLSYNTAATSRSLMEEGGERGREGVGLPPPQSPSKGILKKPSPPPKPYMHLKENRDHGKNGSSYNEDYGFENYNRPGPYDSDHEQDSDRDRDGYGGRGGKYPPRQLPAIKGGRGGEGPIINKFAIAPRDSRGKGGDYDYDSDIVSDSNIVRNNYRNRNNDYNEEIYDNDNDNKEDRGKYLSPHSRRYNRSIAPRPSPEAKAAVDELHRQSSKFFAYDVNSDDEGKEGGRGRERDNSYSMKSSRGYSKKYQGVDAPKPPVDLSIVFGNKTVRDSYDGNASATSSPLKQRSQDQEYNGLSPSQKLHRSCPFATEPQGPQELFNLPSASSKQNSRRMNNMKSIGNSNSSRDNDHYDRDRERAKDNRDRGSVPLHSQRSTVSIVPLTDPYKDREAATEVRTFESEGKRNTRPW